MNIYREVFNCKDGNKKAGNVGYGEVYCDKYRDWCKYLNCNVKYINGTEEIVEVKK